MNLKPFQLKCERIGEQYDILRLRHCLLIIFCHYESGYQKRNGAIFGGHESHMKNK